MIFQRVPRSYKIPDIKTKLLLHCNGSNGSTTFTDSSVYARTVNAQSNAQISTSQYEFGGASGYFDGSSYLSSAYSPDFDFGTGDFTVEAWVYPTSSSDNQAIISGGGYSTGWAMYSKSAGGPQFVCNKDGTGWDTVVRSSTTLSLNTWSHVAAVRNGNTFTIYINGTSAASASYSGNVNTNSASLGIGSEYPYRVPFTGYLDEIRISKGIARYTADFTPQTEEFTI